MSVSQFPLISICIPVYKNAEVLKKLLQSIAIQTFKDFEVVISDDSPDDEVKNLIALFSSHFLIRYFKNNPALGTPANWNFAISKAQGEWIKLMHDDDWFSSEKSLSYFAERTKQNCGFIFSAYTNRYEHTHQQEEIYLPFYAKKIIVHNPHVLVARNVIGPPSVILVKRTIAETYDEHMKWRVDIDYYIRILLKEKNYTYIHQPLINVGISENQVTNDCYNIPSVEIPEAYLLLKKYGTKPLKHILVYDAWWRLLRNLNIKSTDQLKEFGQTSWPLLIFSMVQHLSKWPKTALRIGIISKSLMMFSYCIQYFKKAFRE